MMLSLVYRKSLLALTKASVILTKPAMPKSAIQFRAGILMTDFFTTDVTEAQRAAALNAMCRLDEFLCPCCERADHPVVGHDIHRLVQYQAHCHRAALTARPVKDSPKLPLRRWLLAIYPISQDKTRQSFLAVVRHLGTGFRTAWLVHHHVNTATSKSDGRSRYAGVVDADCAHSLVVAGQSSSRLLPHITYVDAIWENLKTRISVGRKAFKVNQYSDPYPSAFACGFNG